MIDENTEIVTGKERRKVFIRKGQNMSTKVALVMKESALKITEYQIMSNKGHTKYSKMQKMTNMHFYHKHHMKKTLKCTRKKCKQVDVHLWHQKCTFAKFCK